MILQALTMCNEQNIYKNALVSKLSNAKLEHLDYVHAYLM